MTDPTPTPPDHPAQMALQRVMTASGVHRDDPGVSRVPEGFDVRIGEVQQRFRYRPVPRSLDIGRPLGVATRTSDAPWRWSVETSVEMGEMHRLALGGELARGYHARVHAGIAQLEGDRLLLRAHVTAFATHDLRVVTLLGPVARWQRVVALGADLDFASIGALPVRGPRSAHDAAQFDTAVEVFGDLGVTATHALQRGVVRVRLPWSTLEPGPAAELEAQSVLRAELESDVRIDVHAPYRTLDGPGALVETRLPVPEHVGAEEAEGWTERMNAVELDVGAAGPAIGAWSLVVPVLPWCRPMWIHRCAFPNVGGAPPWSLIAGLALLRVRWAVGMHAEHVHHHESEALSWPARSAPVSLRQLVRGSSRGHTSPLAPSRQVPPGVPTLTIASHLWACARARRTGPWIEHVARAAGLLGAGAAGGREQIVDSLDGWMHDAGVATAAAPWAWSSKGTAEAPVGEPAPFAWRLPESDVHNLLARADAADIAVAWRTPLFPGVLGFATQAARRGGVRSERPPLRGSLMEGYQRVPIGRHVVAVDTAASSVPHAEVLVHELAHVLLGHTGSRSTPTRPSVAPPGRQRLDMTVMEAEVSMVVMIVFGRRGVRPDESIVRLVHFLDAARRSGQDGDIDLWHVFAAAERMIAWCLERPDATTVASCGRAPLPLDGLARTAATLDDWVRAVRRGHALVPVRVES